MNNFIIAIDGTAASGKGTISRYLANHYNFNYLDTGLSYRAVAYAVLQQNITPDDEKELLQIASKIDFVKFNEEALKANEVGNLASKIAVNPKLREILVQKQREFTNNSAKGAILDGRDIGTIVCPQAHVKLYVDAELNVRALRRFEMLRQANIKISQQQVLQQLQERDERDKNRATGALLKLSTAYAIDTTNLTIEETINKAKNIIEPALNGFLGLK